MSCERFHACFLCTGLANARVPISLKNNMQRPTGGVNRVSVDCRSNGKIPHRILDDRYDVWAHYCAIPVHAIASDGFRQIGEDVAGGHPIGADVAGGNIPCRAM